MGGNAFDNVSPISCADIDKVIYEIEDVFPDKWALLGSAGKKLFSGDIDIGISDSLVSNNTMYEILVAKLGSENVKLNKGTNMIFTRIKVPNSDKFCQVDFVVGNLPWLKFAFYSDEGVTSNFKGVYRTELFSSIISSLQTPIYDGREIVARSGPMFSHTKGVIPIYKLRPIKQNGHGRTKSEKNVTRREFIEFCRYICYEDIPDETPSSQDIGEICKQYLEIPNVSFENCRWLNSFESIAEAIYDPFYGYLIDAELVFDIFEKKINNRGLTLTEEMKEICGL